MALVTAFLGLTVATDGLAAEPQSDRRYGASLNESQWTVERDESACHLLHPIPRFGLAVFSRDADRDQVLRIYTHRPPRNARTVELWSEPTEWRDGSLRRVGFTRAMEDPRTFLLNHPMSNRVLQELERGQRPLMTFEDWHAPGEQVALAIANAGFRPMYERYLSCAGDLEPADIPARTSATDAQAIADGDPGVMVVPGPAAQQTATRPAPPETEILARYGQAPPPGPEATEDEQAAQADDGGDGAERPVHFVFDNTRLTRTERDHLRAFIDDLEDDRGTITITGHTDSSGDPAYNRRLGEARAEAVREYLVDKGVDPDRITTATAGEESPAEDNDTADGKAANRRASLHLRKR